MNPPTRATRFHALIRGETRGLGAMLGRAALWWLRMPYGVGVGVRNWLFDRHWKQSIRVPVPVVSVGNLTLGGTGKTPCVEAVARYFRGLGCQVAILSRGYGSESGRNDEALVLEENLPDVPHLQGVDRVSLALTAIQELESDVLVLDDGFQHRRLARDLDIVLVDATQPLPDEYLFPRGLLREPRSALRRADVIVVTRVDQGSSRTFDWLRTNYPDKVLATATHTPYDLLGSNGSEPVSVLNRRAVGAFCGLGNPEAFRQTLQDLGATVADFRLYPDHHPYTREDVASLSQWANTLPREAWIITTQKDQVKLRLVDLAGRPVRALRIGMQFRDGEAEIQGKLAGLVQGRMTHDD